MGKYLILWLPINFLLSCLLLYGMHASEFATIDSVEEFVVKSIINIFVLTFLDIFIYVVQYE